MEYDDLNIPVKSKNDKKIDVTFKLPENSIRYQILELYYVSLFYVPNNQFDHFSNVTGNYFSALNILKYPWMTSGCHENNVGNGGTVTTEFPCKCINLNFSVRKSFFWLWQKIKFSTLSNKSITWFLLNFVSLFDIIAW